MLNKEILFFLVAVTLISSVPWTLMISTGHIRVGGDNSVNLLMWSPALAAFGVCALLRIPFASLGWGGRPKKYVWMGYFIPIFYAVPVYLTAWFFVPGAFTPATFVQSSAKLFEQPNHPYLAAFAMNLPLLLSAQLVQSLPRALGEEIGWRGFLLPRLVERFGFGAGCFGSGIIWALWHSPVLLGADYNAGTQPAYALGCFAVLVTAQCYTFGWLRLKSGSVWPCAFLHAMHNIIIQSLLDRMTATTGRAPYFTTEFGCGLALISVLVVLYFYSRRGELPQVAERKQTVLEARHFGLRNE